MTADGSAAVLVTGVYGAGKTTVVEELADLLEQAGEPYAAIDLDGWRGRTSLAADNVDGPRATALAILALLGWAAAG